MDERRSGLVGSRPIASHRNPLSICQNETCNVDGIGGRVLTAPAARTVIDIAAGAGAEMDDPHHVLPKMLPCSFLQDIRLERSPGPCARAGGREFSVQANRGS